MRNVLLSVLLAAFAAPSAVLAQGFPGMTPELQAQMQTARANATTAVYAALTADHKTKIQAVITSFNNGGVSIADAVKQIDAILTPDEAKAVLDQGLKMREAMRAAFIAANGGSPPPAMQRREGGAPGQAQPPRTPDAGRVLLGMAASQDALRAAMQP